MTTIITRFPPSPTGLFHIGSARTALFNYLYASNPKAEKGSHMVLRIEDTDRERSKDEYTKNIEDGLRWLGIAHEGEVFHQSKRGPIYKTYLEKMIEEKHAYVSEEKAEEGKRSSVIRFKNPNHPVTFHDEVRGDITVDTTDLGDFVIAKDLDTPLYHLAVVVDDHESGVTHVLRGEDGIANTPRQVLLQEAIGAKRPIYAHIPFILAPDKTKLSKRHGATALTDYREQGYLPEAVINFLALLGWNPGDDREIFSLEALKQEFSLERIQKSAAIFNVDKLDWFNAEYIKTMGKDAFDAYLKPLHDALTARHNIPITSAFRAYQYAVLQHSMVKIADVVVQVETGEFDCYFKAPSVTSDALLSKGSIDKAKAIAHLNKVAELLGAVTDWTDMAIKETVMTYANAEGRKEVLWPMRYALSGRDRSPDPFFLASVFGLVETRARLRNAIDILSR